MKKVVFLFALAWLAVIATKAENYGYIVFQQNSGAVQTVDAMGLKITFSDGQLIATPTTGKPVCLSLADMAAMRFATESVTGISSIGTEAGVSVRDGSIAVALDANSRASIVTPSGVTVAQFSTAGTVSTFATKTLPGGIYIVKTNKTTTKILVR